MDGGLKRSHTSSQGGLPPFPVPYELPPVEYSSNDEPWIIDEASKLPDVFGNVWEPQ
ncbi:unnamed protein product [Trichobilharzia regenti]|nr:unnamed protein product [Trichobilharzia regenti]